MMRENDIDRSDVSWGEVSTKRKKILNPIKKKRLQSNKEGKN